LQRDDAEHVQRVRVLGLAREYRPIRVLGLGQPAGSMLLERERESFVDAVLLPHGSWSALTPGSS
jgi:hypothetical protein